MAHSDNVMRVSKTSPPQKLASAIAHALQAKPNEVVVLRAIGAGAVNQAVKALAITGGFVGVTGRSVKFTVGFETAQGEQQDVSAIVIRASYDQ